MRRRLLAVLLWSVASMGAFAGAARSAPFDHTHAGWTALLTRYVHDGSVDYTAWRRSGVRDLDAYLRALEGARVAGWSRDQQTAYWVNAYNAYTVRLILRNYPVKSIKAIGLGVFTQRFIPLGPQQDEQLGRPLGRAGRRISLDDVEHAILREQLRDPRIHFAIVCASVSCPTLRGTAYRPDSLQTQLEQAARAFLRDPSKNRYDAGKATFFASAIFDWFHRDFEAAAGTVPAFLEQYADPAASLALHKNKARIEYLPYDWSLNGR